MRSGLSLRYPTRPPGALGRVQRQQPTPGQPQPGRRSEKADSRRLRLFPGKRCQGNIFCKGVSYTKSLTLPGKKSVFGYKVHAVICHHADLPLFVLVTPAHVHDSLVGWFVILVAALLFGLQVLVVYADAAYFDRRTFRVVHDILGAHPAIHYNLREAGKKKLATLEFLDQWQRLVTSPRTAIERHFAWMKRYFGLKYFQCFTLLHVMQFVQLTYIAALAVALAAERYQRPELNRRRSLVLAHL